MTNNPTIALDSILETENTVKENIKVYPLTIARYALLELINSPLLTGKVATQINVLLPTFYIMTADTFKLKGYTSKNLDKLESDAIEWGDSIDDISVVEYVFKNVLDKILQMNKVAPTGSSESSKKNQAMNQQTVG